jgi:PTS system nitrogen regulatory IIA component
MANTQLSKMDWLNELVTDLRAGEVYFNLQGQDSSTIIKSFVSVLNIPKSIDKRVLTEAFLEREKLMSTAIGKGCAIPHLRQDVAKSLNTTYFSIGYLDYPVKWGIYDDVWVDTLFLFFSSDSKRHLTILSGIAELLADEKIMDLLTKRQDKLSILNYLENITTSVDNKY